MTVEISADDVHAHWPDRVVSPHEEVVFCACGEEFRSATERTDELWAAHVATELAAHAQAFAN